MASGREECTVGARSGQGAGQAHTLSSGDSIRSADWWAAYRPIADLQAPQLSASNGSAPPARGFPGPSTQSAVTDQPVAAAQMPGSRDCNARYSGRSGDWYKERRQLLQRFRGLAPISAGPDFGRSSGRRRRFRRSRASWKNRLRVSS